MDNLEVREQVENLLWEMEKLVKATRMLLSGASDTGMCLDTPKRIIQDVVANLVAISMRIG